MKTSNTIFLKSAILLIVICLAFAGYADAARFGGGRSRGMQRSNFYSNNYSNGTSSFNANNSRSYNNNSYTNHLNSNNGNTNAYNNNPVNSGRMGAGTAAALGAAGGLAGGYLLGHSIANSNNGSNNVNNTSANPANNTDSATINTANNNSNGTGNAINNQSNPINASNQPTTSNQSSTAASTSANSINNNLGDNFPWGIVLILVILLIIGLMFFRKKTNSNGINQATAMDRLKQLGNWRNNQQQNATNMYNNGNDRMPMSGIDSPSSTPTGAQREWPRMSLNRQTSANINNQDKEQYKRMPDGVEEIYFLRQAKGMFLHIQSMNNATNLDEIAKYLTPELYQEMRQEIASNSYIADFTNLNCRLLDARTQENALLASVEFAGQVSDEPNKNAEPFNETWHFIKPDMAINRWLVAGIEPNNNETSGDNIASTTQDNYSQRNI